MKSFFIILGIILPSTSWADSTGKEKDSPLVMGSITSVSDDGTTVEILHQGKSQRTVIIGEKTKVSFISLKDPVLKTGLSVKASLSGDKAKSLKLTPAIPDFEGLGDGKEKLVIGEVFQNSDTNSSGSIDYVEMSRWIYHSQKHGPDKFQKADKDSNGALDEKEFSKLLAEVVWWKYSRKSLEDWFAQADQDADEKLTDAEFKTIATGKNHADQHFKRTDRDRNGSIDLEELGKYLGK